MHGSGETLHTHTDGYCQAVSSVSTAAMVLPVEAQNESWEGCYPFKGGTEGDMRLYVLQLPAAALPEPAKQALAAMHDALACPALWAPE